jgi:hypothetical protein
VYHVHIFQVARLQKNASDFDLAAAECAILPCQLRLKVDSVEKGGRAEIPGHFFIAQRFKYTTVHASDVSKANRQVLHRNMPGAHRLLILQNAAW